MLRILLGGSPCTKWSVAQKNGRETEPSGIGWELFKNYLIAKEKFKPDYILYENNKSAAQAIKDQIKREFNVYDGTMLMKDSGARYIEINSALVSAQNRQRFYVHNVPGVEQPGDRGILLKDVLESGLDLTQNEKAYALTASYNGAVAWNTIERKQRNMVAEPVIFQRPRGKNKGGIKYDKSPTLTANGSWEQNNKVVQPIRIGTIESGERSFLSDSQANRVYSPYGKSVTINSGGGGGVGAKTGLYATPIKVGEINGGGQGNRIYSTQGKAVAQTSQSGGAGSNTGLYAVPIECEELDTDYYKGCQDSNLVGKIVGKGKYKNGKQPSQQYRVYSAEQKSVCLDTDNRKHYMCPINATADGKARTIKAQYYKNGIANFVTNGGFGATAVAESATTLKNAYFVESGQITIKGKQYPIKLPDGYYIIRKLTVNECRRLQTIPDWYKMPCSNSQNYKMLGNGWTVEVIKHILQNIPNLRNEPIEVLSMYDGMSCGQITLQELGCNVIKYKSYEIDKYAIETTQANFADTIQCGDAFQVRNENWGY